MFRDRTTRPLDLNNGQKRRVAHRWAAALMPKFWALLNEKNSDLGEQQVHAGVLALFDPQDPRWRDLGPPLAAKLVRQNPLLIGAWREVFQPISGRLVEPLRARFGDRSRPEKRALAYTLLLSFATQPGNPNQPEDLAELFADADPTQFREVLDTLSDQGRAVAHLMSRLREPARFDDVLARRQGQMAAALAKLGQTDCVWPLLKHGEDPSLRTELIHDLAAFGADVRLVVARLGAEPDISARWALILALGEYPIAQVPAEARRALSDSLLRSYREHPDPGLHSAIDWLLRQKWGLEIELDRIDRELSSPDWPKGRDWYVNAQGQTMAVVRGPVEFLMGSPESEPGHDALFEIRHRVRIPRSFAIATREMTVAQYARFLDDNPDLQRWDKDEKVKPISPTPDCPGRRLESRWEISYIHGG